MYVYKSQIALLYKLYIYVYKWVYSIYMFALLCDTSSGDIVSRV
jgi:hypothetical protein